MTRTPRVAALVFYAATLAGPLTGCGVPKAEYEKIASELEQANQEKMALTDRLDQANVEKEAAAETVAQLQGAVDELKKENEALKAKLAPKTMAANKR